MCKILAILFLCSSFAYAQDELIVSFNDNQVCVPETDDCLSTLTVITSKNTYTLENLLGSFYHSKRNNQILDCGGNTLSSGLNANLINSNGIKLPIQHKSGVADCGLTGDQKYYFIVDESPSLRVYDSKANLLLTKSVEFQSLIKYKINGVAYELWVPGIP
ncbi:hypothetical protein [Colwellia piezophila]|uniref:hypothetical protein n=1 Tax=Colwellia piezophila TaxID=211668 RepID=UPI0012FA66EB|nr:hypothetical protein [Colwellia piezophila]